MPKKREVRPNRLSGGRLATALKVMPDRLGWWLGDVCRFTRPGQ